LDSSFSTVNDFLRQAADAKAGKKEAIASSISPHLQDPGTVGVPPSFGKKINRLVSDYGDEAYRQIALFALGKWFETHTEAAEDFFGTGQLPEACACLMDATRISDSLHLICEVGSLGGSEEWKEMLEKEISQAILEDLEER
jgi:hypothetical protein